MVIDTLSQVFIGLNADASNKYYGLQDKGHIAT